MRVFEERGITHLDLHGTKHQDVSSEVLNFTYQYQELLPLVIIFSFNICFFCQNKIKKIYNAKLFI